MRISFDPAKDAANIVKHGASLADFEGFDAEANISDFDENPEWTDDMIARARPASEVHSPQVVSALLKRGRGRPAGSDKERVTLRIDRETLERFRASGPGWQTRINDVLRRAIG